MSNLEHVDNITYRRGVKQIRKEMILLFLPAVALAGFLLFVIVQAYFHWQSVGGLECPHLGI